MRKRTEIIVLKFITNIWIKTCISVSYRVLLTVSEKENNIFILKMTEEYILCIVSVIDQCKEPSVSVQRYPMASGT
jgi:hypothetical protein